MKRVWCDLCDKEQTTERFFPSLYVKMEEITFCDECYEKVTRYILSLKNKKHNWKDVSLEDLK